MHYMLTYLHKYMVHTKYALYLYVHAYNTYMSNNVLNCGDLK